MNGIAWLSSGLSVEVVALDEDRMIRLATNPHVAFSDQFELDAFSDV